MGCGGSKADTIEPRYYDSWTRETESTWLTNTDTEAGQQTAPGGGGGGGHQRGTSDSASAAKAGATTCQGKGEDLTCLGASAREKKLVNVATQCGKQPLHSTNSFSNPRRPLHRDEVKTKTKKMFSKEASSDTSGQHTICTEEKSAISGLK
ncbi:BAALC binder of MAP3K1 and KLF4 a [Denticeps clupeoides]|uniref:BAALC n=1 Tax=Denticeps clupeoides TaxID=299321 RepID=A0AAY3ZWK8_9TELE|nr:brain and acute leukemia cytoplasmic protein [Denticeps clupeoides]